MNVFRDYSQPGLPCLLIHFTQNLLVCADVRLVIGNLQQFYLLKSPFNVFLCDTGLSAHVGQGEVRFVFVLSDKIHQSLAPPREVGFVAEV